MRCFVRQRPFAQAIFCCISKGKFNLYCDDFVCQHRCLVTVAPQMTDKSHKNFEQVRLTATTRAGDGRLAREGSVRNFSIVLFNLSGYEVHVFRILNNFLSFRLITEIISF